MRPGAWRGHARPMKPMLRCWYVTGAKHLPVRRCCSPIREPIGKQPDQPGFCDWNPACFWQIRLQASEKKNPATVHVAGFPYLTWWPGTESKKLCRASSHAPSEKLQNSRGTGEGTVVEKQRNGHWFEDESAISMTLRSSEGRRLITCTEAVIWCSTGHPLRQLTVLTLSSCAPLPSSVRGNPLPIHSQSRHDKQRRPP